MLLNGEQNLSWQVNTFFGQWKYHVSSDERINTSVQSRLRFCVIDTEYSILTQNEMIVESHWRTKRNKQKPKKQVTSYITTSKAAGNNKSKLKQICVLTSLKWGREMTGISDYGCMSTFCVRRPKQFQERLEPTSTFCILSHTLLYRSIDASFVHFVLVFTFHYEMTAKA